MDGLMPNEFPNVHESPFLLTQSDGSRLKREPVRHHFCVYICGALKVTLSYLLTRSLI